MLSPAFRAAFSSRNAGGSSMTTAEAMLSQHAAGPQLRERAGQ
jgi:hypothetical protein